MAQPNQSTNEIECRPSAHAASPTGADDRPAKRADKPVRLSVNLGSGPAAALRELMAKREITATEAIRRAISVLKFIEDEVARGNRIAIVETRGGDDRVREVVFHLDA